MTRSEVIVQLVAAIASGNAASATPPTFSPRCVVTEAEELLAELESRGHVFSMEE